MKKEEDEAEEGSEGWKDEDDDYSGKEKTW